MPPPLQRAEVFGPGAQGADAGASLSPTPTLTDVHRSPTSVSPSTTAPPIAESSRASPRPKHQPLLTLSPSVIPDLDPQHEEDISVIWNVISRTADVLKDGERLENLAWRHWGAPRSRRRRSSCTTAATESSAEIGTPSERSGLASLPRNHSFERRSFTGTLKLLVEESSFKDWVGDARKKHLPDKLSPINSTARSPTSPEIATTTNCSSTAQSLPTTATSPSTPNSSLAPPDTPVANLEIRLVEPTPVPSRVGSLGGSLGTVNTIPPARPNLVPENINEVTSDSESSPVVAAADSAASAGGPQQRNRRANNNNRFFIQSSPSKVSGSSSSQPSSVPKEPPPEQVVQPGSVGSHLRSSGESSSAIVIIKKKERRHVSMANMRGRFAGEKARAAQAIAARNQPEDEDSDDDEEWEDEDDDGAEEDDEGGEEEAENDDGDDDGDDDDWEDEPSAVLEKPPVIPLGRRGSRGVTIPPAPTPPRTKKERAAEKARLDAERDALRKREMFAKQRVTYAPKIHEGLLTRTFRTGKSMIDLTQAGEDDIEPEPGLRRAPTAAQLSQLQLSSSPGSSLLRTKSTAAIPVQSGVSVTSHSHNSGASEELGTARLPPPGPEGMEMETSDEESDDDDYLQSEEVRAKLSALAAKREERDRAKTIPQPVGVATPGELDPNGIVRPLSPTSRRRAIIMREMSESLRKNIIIEREKSSGRPPNMQGPHKRPPPSVHLSRLPSSNSAINLAQYQAGAHGGEPLQRHLSNQVHDFKRSQLERHSSHPNLTAMHVDHPTSPPPQANAASVSPEHRRRANVLGSGFLRPLTRVEGAAIGRTHSVAHISNMVTSPTSDHGPSANSHSSGASGGSSGRMHPLQAPAMQRSSTEGGKDMERARQRKELAKRGDHTDTSYRFHGW